MYTSLTHFIKKIRSTSSGYLLVIGVLIVNTLIPQTAFAANKFCLLDNPAVKGITKYILYPACLINKLIIPLAVSIEILFFVIGVIRYLANAENEKERTEGNKFMVWGIVALLVTFCFWGLVGILSNTFQIGR
jgi:hypothetical protein